MANLRLLLCTDMDRTVIPNGAQQEHPDARENFHTLCKLPGVELVYVTGRDLNLVEEAIGQYSLPRPGWLITDVGTKIYQSTATGYKELTLWQELISRDWHGKTHRELQQVLSQIKEIKLQESDKQNDFKLSYYFTLESDLSRVIKEVRKRLDTIGAAVNIITSIDETEQVGLLDILPVSADKLHGLLFLQEHLGYLDEEVIFAGDSGNDLPVLVSSIRSILVANAAPELQSQIAKTARDNNNYDAFYQADSNFYLGGNYSAGVIQGVFHYMPQIKDLFNKTS